MTSGEYVLWSSWLTVFSPNLAESHVVTPPKFSLALSFQSYFEPICSENDLETVKLMMLTLIMQSRTKSKLLKLFIFSGISAFALFSLMVFATQDDTAAAAAKADKIFAEQVEQRTHVAKLLADQFRNNEMPSQAKLNWNGKDLQNVTVKYTLDEDLQKEARRLLTSYKPDYGAILLMDATTGEVLAMESFQRDNPQAPNMNLQATFPAASIFKVVTATAAVDKAGVTPDHKIHYNGGAHTLYKKNVLSDRVTRW
ncbi:MAG TPA: penicillin-binding transpeptidase domain-containing protein, partial [Bdellovibrio sp.]|nr:penicillin-binding transpeptidase domain-containing protein [Bdellovibrio sp.]